MRVSVKITGDKALIGSLGLMNVVGRKKLERAVDRSSAAILSDALALVPRRTGELAKTLRRRIATSGMSASVMAGYGELAHKGKAAVKRARGLKVNEGKGVYAPVVEFGSTTQPAQPFLFPALEAEKPKFVEACNDALDQALAEAARSV